MQGKKDDLSITLQIDEGPQTMVGNCRLAATKRHWPAPFPDLNISPGQAFGYSKINEDREIILNYYFNNGFPNATFDASAKRSPGNPLLDGRYVHHPRGRAGHRGPCLHLPDWFTPAPLSCSVKSRSSRAIR